MKSSIQCVDKYEAQKLASMLYAKDGVEAQLAEILNVIGTECVVRLRDGSAHSILLIDTENATRFADFIQSIKDGAHKIVGGKADDDIVIIEKS